MINMNSVKKYTIKELRVLCQDSGPPKDKQTLFGRIIRIFSIYATAIFIRTKITPNQITVFGTVLYIIGAGLYAIGNHWFAVAGFLLFTIETFLDASDGEVHRFRKYKGGYGGSYVEPFSHDIKYAFIFMPIAFGAYLMTNNPFVLIAGAAATIFKLLYRLTEIRFFYGVTKQLPIKGQTDDTIPFHKIQGLKKLIYIFYRQTATSTGMLTPLLITTLFGRTDIFIHVYGIIFALLWFGILGRQLKRFSKISQQVLDRHAYTQEIKERLKNKKVIIFDLDGTLLDSMGIFAEIASFLIAWRHKVSRAEAKKMYIATCGIPFFQQLDVLFPKHPANKGIASLFEEKKVHATEHLEIDEEEKKALKRLADKNYKLAISSNNFQKNTDMFNEFTDVKFHYVLGFRDGFEKGKHHFDYIITKESITPNEILFIGDALSDMRKAEELGIDFIGKTGTFSEKEFLAENPNAFTIRTLSELLDIL